MSKITITSGHGVVLVRESVKGDVDVRSMGGDMQVHGVEVRPFFIGGSSLRGGRLEVSTGSGRDRKRVRRVLRDSIRLSRD